MLENFHYGKDWKIGIMLYVVRKPPHTLHTNQGLLHSSQYAAPSLVPIPTTDCPRILTPTEEQNFHHTKRVKYKIRITWVNSKDGAIKKT